MRYLTQYLQKDITHKMIILSGPRQSGKTTLSKGLLDPHGTYLNWDIPTQQKIIRERSWSKTSSLVIFDELHKMLRWKNFLKEITDEFQNTPPILVTGSARLDIFKNEGDALTGRYYHYRLHPVDLQESKAFLPHKNATERLDHILKTGGFPESILHPENANRLRMNRLNVVLYEDLRDLNKMPSTRGLKLLIELLRERIGQQVNESHLAQDIGVSPTTIKHWIILLENLYVIFLVSPYSKGLARSIRKERKVYFYDSSNGLSPGAILENTVACSLLKYCHFLRDTQGEEMELYYFRDKDGREVDFIITENKNIKWLLEVKESDTQLSKSLEYLHKKLKAPYSFQLVKNIPIEKEIRGIKVTSMALWLDSIH